MVGTLPLHLGEGIAFGVLCEHHLEVGFGHASPADEILAFEDADTLAEAFFERLKPILVMTMPGPGKPYEVHRSVVKLVAIEMMTLLSFSR